MKNVLAFLLMFISLPGFCQQFNFINYSVKDGLAQSQVTDICQDQNGYLWIGTESGGLSRFDGVEFLNFGTDDGLADNKIEDLFIDADGVLWVATSLGISKYVDHEFTPYFFEEPLRINDISEFKGEIYLASNTGLIKFEKEGFKHLVLNDQEELYLRALENYGDSILICGSKSGVYVWRDEKFSHFGQADFSEKNVLDLQVLEDKLYVSAHREGIFVYDFTRKISEKTDIEYSRTRAFYVDSSSFLGVTIGQGVYAKENGEINLFNEKSGLPTNNLNCIFKDAEKNIWIGTDGKGLLKFSGRSIIFYSVKDNLSSDLVVSINQYEDGEFIFGTYDAGITIMDKNGEMSYLDRNSGLRDNTVWSLAIDRQNRCWIGTAKGVTLLADSEVRDHPLKDVDTKIRSIVEVDDSTMLLGGDDGLFIIQNDSLYNVHPEFNIFKLLVYNNKVYCAGTNGLFEFEQNGDFTGYRKIELPENTVNTITGDQYGNLWIGTENGLFATDTKGKVLPVPLDRQEYNSKTILGLITNQEGDIWVSTMNGVYEIVPQDVNSHRYKILHYGIAEGLINLECNANALFEDTDHNIWVGTSSGLAKIDPSLNDELFDLRPPILHITGIRLFMEEFDYENYTLEFDRTFGIPSSIELPYNKNHLTFDFIGINLKDPASVKYEYRLIGTNGIWSPLSDMRYATYSFIQPGEYDFEVRATNKNHVWSNIQRIKIIVLPPFWRTWWFIILVFITILFVIVVIFRVRIRSIRQTQENEKLGFKNRLLFLEQQSLNASMNRHFIFNSLNSIQYFINSQDKLSANKYLSSFAKLIRKNLDSSSANNFIVSLQEEIDRIELYLSLEKMRFSDKFDYTIDLDPGLDTESIEIPSMILQPFVENSIIHGVLPLEQMGNINIRIYEEFDEVVFEVVDDGVGIDNSLKMKKNSSLGDHKSKGMDITNRRIELLRKLTGENLLIIGPFQMNNESGECLGTKVIIKMSIERHQ